MTNEDWDKLRAIAIEEGCRVDEGELLDLLLERAGGLQNLALWQQEHYDETRTC